MKKTIAAILAASALAGGCATTSSPQISEKEYNTLATKVAANDARNFCDESHPGRSMADDEYADCYYAVLEQRGRYFRGELEGQAGRPDVSELIEAPVTN
jgi:hypothetical protein